MAGAPGALARCSWRSPSRRRCCGRSRTSRSPATRSHSLLGTRDTAQTLERITGLGQVPLTAPRRLGEILREPVLFGAAGGGMLSLLWLRDRARLGAAAGVIAIVAFCVLATAGLPILGRYLLLPAAILAIFCGAGAFGWACLPRGDPRRRPWAWFGVATLVLLVVFTPAQVDRVRALRHALARQDTIQSDLAALVRIPPAAIRASCAPVTVPNHRPVPLLALFLDTDPTAIVSAQEERPRRGTWVTPASPPSPTTTSSTRATSTGASRRRRSGCGSPASTRRGASSPAAEGEEWTVHPPSSRSAGALASATAPARGSRCAHR